MHITYLQHSGFIVELPDAVLVFDYYRDPAHVLPHVLKQNPAKPVVFLVSHHHPDHFNPEIFDLAQDHKRVYILSNDILAKRIPTDLAVQGMSRGDVVENLPGNISVRAYGSTDKGVSFLVTTSSGRKIFHAGDLNDWHWQDESSEREVRKADNAFMTILNRFADENPHLYVAMFPVDHRMGTDYARGARLFLAKVTVDNFFPMHFDADWKEACDFASFAGSQAESCHCFHSPGQTVELPD